MKAFYILIIAVFFITCKKQVVSKIGIEITNPREGLVINFNGSSNRLYFVKVAFSSNKPLKQIEYKIINKANGAIVSNYLDDDLNNITDTNFEISEYMPLGNVALNVEFTCKATDVDSYTQSKLVNYSLVP